jgi:hypothetical protein
MLYLNCVDCRVVCAIIHNRCTLGKALHVAE